MWHFRLVSFLLSDAAQEPSAALSGHLSPHRSQSLHRLSCGLNAAVASSPRVLARCHSDSLLSHGQCLGGHGCTSTVHAELGRADAENSALLYQDQEVARLHTTQHAIRWRRGIDRPVPRSSCRFLGTLPFNLQPFGTGLWFGSLVYLLTHNDGDIETQVVPPHRTRDNSAATTTDSSPLLPIGAFPAHRAGSLADCDPAH